MTIEELEKLGFTHLQMKIYPRRFFMPILGERDIPEYYKLTAIFEMYFDKGKEEGVEKGKQDKVNEFRNLLNLKSK
jgi:hypothetical protein